MDKVEDKDISPLNPCLYSLAFTSMIYISFLNLPAVVEDKEMLRCGTYGKNQQL